MRRERRGERGKGCVGANGWDGMGWDGPGQEERGLDEDWTREGRGRGWNRAAGERQQSVRPLDGRDGCSTKELTTAQRSRPAAAAAAISGALPRACCRAVPPCLVPRNFISLSAGHSSDAGIL